MAQGFLTLTIRDYDAEAAITRLRVPTLTAANFDAQAGLRQTFLTTALAMTEVPAAAGVYYGNEQTNDMLPDDDPLSQRENKWLVQYHDAVTAEPGHFYIPCADLTLLDPNDRAHANIGDGDKVDAFVTNAEAFLETEASNAIVVDEITFVAR